MKISYHRPLVTILVLITISIMRLAAQNGSIELHIKNIDYPKSGRLHIWLFNQSDYYQMAEKSALHRTTPVVSREYRHTLSNIPSGEYVIVALQDLNDNEKLDYTPVIHYAKEPIGFSNMLPWLIYPSYKQCKFNVDSEHSIPITISLRKGFLLTPFWRERKTKQ